MDVLEEDKINKKRYETGSGKRRPEPFLDRRSQLVITDNSETKNLKTDFSSNDETETKSSTEYESSNKPKIELKGEAKLQLSEKYSKQLKTIRRVAAAGSALAKASGHKELAEGLGELANASKEASEGGPEGLRKAGSNIAGKGAGVLAEGALGISGGSGAALGGAVSSALQGEGLKGVAEGAISWYFLYIAFALLVDPITFYPALIYLDFHYLMSKFGSKLFGQLGLIQKLILLGANILGIIVFILGVGMILYLGCNYPVGSIGGKYYGSVIGISGGEQNCEQLGSISSSIGLSNSSLSLKNPSTNLTTSGGACVAPPSGDASAAYMSGTCFGSSNAYTASIVAAHESGGNPTIPSGVDICKDANGNNVTINGVPAAVSFGLFQINITSHKIGSLNCPAAFSYPSNVTVKEYDANNHQCSVVDPILYNNCVQAAEDPAQNVQAACLISQNGSNWNAWKADILACGIPSS